MDKFIDKIVDLCYLIFKPEGSLFNSIVKALLIGFISGLLLGLTGEDLDFKIHNEYGRDGNYEHYGTVQAFIGGIIITLLLFLRYNKQDLNDEDDDYEDD